MRVVVVVVVAAAAAAAAVPVPVPVPYQYQYINAMLDEYLLWPSIRLYILSQNVVLK